jgi:tetratricopeptide (TPR) repeat protein
VDPRQRAAYDVVAARPGDAKAWFDLGVALQAASAQAEAVDAYDRAIGLAPKSAAAFHNRGLAQSALGRRDLAIADFRQAIQLEPRLADAHFNLGNALVQNGSRVEAADSFQKAVALRPDFAAAWHNLGDSLQALNDLDGAFAAYRFALRHAPDAFPRIVNTLTAHAHGMLWLDFSALKLHLSNAD